MSPEVKPVFPLTWKALYDRSSHPLHSISRLISFHTFPRSLQSSHMCFFAYLEQSGLRPAPGSCLHVILSGQPSQTELLKLDHRSHHDTAHLPSSLNLSP